MPSAVTGASHLPQALVGYLLRCAEALPALVPTPAALDAGDCCSAAYTAPCSGEGRPVPKVTTWLRNLPCQRDVCCSCVDQEPATANVQASARRRALLLT